MKKNEYEEDFFAIGICPNMTTDKTLNVIVGEKAYDWLERMMGYGGFRRYSMDLYDAPVRHDNYNYGGMEFVKMEADKVREKLKELWNIEIPEYDGKMWFTEFRDGKINFVGKEAEYRDTFNEGVLLEMKDGILTSRYCKTTREEAVLDAGRLLDYMEEMKIIDGGERKKLEVDLNKEEVNLNIKPMECFSRLVLKDAKLKDVIPEADRFLTEDWNIKVDLGNTESLTKSFYGKPGREIYTLEKMNRSSGLHGENKNEIFYFKKNFNKADALNFIREWDKNIKMKNKVRKTGREEENNGRRRR